MKNKNTIIIVIVFVLIVAGGGYFVLSQNTAKKPIASQAQEEEVVPTILPDDIGLKTTLRDDKKAIKFEINAKDIESIEYQISYTKEVNGEQVSEGLIGEAKSSGEDKIEIKYREFGTCSSGKCRYDKVVSSVKILLKIIKKDGKVFQSEKTVEL
ncbi:hypothetical protein C4559_02615 [Candidatus Microgenomates bacterium]|nr:MAG: hypothetical protein C4559_02615 [Candidatus Microgenomates bacterium]